MNKFSRFIVAVPEAGLLEPGGDRKLAFAGKAWVRLNVYLRMVEGLPNTFDADDPFGDCVAKLKSVAENVGSPRRLRELLTQNPGLLADRQPPATLYGSMVWLSQLLGSSALKVSTTLESLAELIGRSGEDIKNSVEAIAHEPTFPAREIINASQSLTFLVNTTMSSLLRAHDNLAAVFKSSADRLSKLQEMVGGLTYEIKSKKKAVEDMGFLDSAFSHKKENLQKELEKIQLELPDVSGKAERLRAIISKIEPVINERAWVEEGFKNLCEYLGTVAKVFEALELGLVQLADEAESSQFEDAKLFKDALGYDDAIKQWKIIGDAASQFTTSALVDFD